MTTRRQHILVVNPDALAQWLHDQGEPDYRLEQILDWLYVKRVDSFDAMSTLAKGVRAALAKSFFIGGLKQIDCLQSEQGDTSKFLFELNDGEQIESVLMGTGAKSTFCISSQVGCALACQFCATGSMGFKRDLHASEILGQVAALARVNGSVGNVVFMGMGEPLLNLDAVLAALTALTDKRRFALGSRRITVSTAGITPGIRRLGRHSVHPNLALSLNSPFDEQRSELMRINRKFPIAELLDACEKYANVTKTRILLEYVLLGKVNTSEAAARKLGRIATKLRALVNLIPFNPIEKVSFEAPGRAEVQRFKATLENQGVTVSERFRRGQDIAAGCGQLKAARDARR